MTATGEQSDQALVFVTHVNPHTIHLKLKQRLMHKLELHWSCSKPTC